MNSRSRSPKKSESGMATIEAISLLIIFSVMASYSLGTFGVVHSGIVNSIVARAYAFETFRQRSNLVYWRDDRALRKNPEYLSSGFRFHGVTSEESKDERWRASERPLAIGREDDGSGPKSSNHSDLDQLTKVERMGVNPVWIKVVYGICVNRTCGRQER